MANEDEKEEIRKDVVAEKLTEAVKHYKKEGNIENYDIKKLDTLSNFAGYEDFDQLLHEWKLERGEETYQLREKAAKNLAKAIDQIEKEGTTVFDKADLDLWASFAGYEDFNQLYREYQRFGVIIRYGDDENDG